MLKRSVIALLLLTIFSKTAESIPYVETVRLKKVSEFPVKTTVKGQVIAGQVLEISSENSGLISYIAKSGDDIKKGEILLEISDSYFDKSLENATELAKIAKKEYLRSQELYKKGAISIQVFESSFKDMLEKEKQLINAKHKKNKNIFYAPFDGKVSISKYKQGSFISNGTKIIEFVNDKNLIVEFYFPGVLTQEHYVEINKKVLPITEVFLDKNGLTTAHVSLSKVKIGDIIDVEVISEVKNNVSIIPFDTLFMKNGKLSVYIVEDKKAFLKPVSIGARNQDMIEVFGLKDDQVLVLTGQSRLYDGCEVNIK